MTKILVGKPSPLRDTLRQNWCPLKWHHRCVVTAFECKYGPSCNRPPLWCPLPLTISQENEEEEEEEEKEEDTPFYAEVRRRMALDPLDSRSIEEAIDAHPSREKSD